MSSNTASSLQEKGNLHLQESLGPTEGDYGNMVLRSPLSIHYQIEPWRIEGAIEQSLRVLDREVHLVCCNLRKEIISVKVSVLTTNNGQSVMCGMVNLSGFEEPNKFHCTRVEF